MCRSRTGLRAASRVPLHGIATSSSTNRSVSCVPLSSSTNLDMSPNGAKLISISWGKFKVKTYDRTNVHDARTEISLKSGFITLMYTNFARYVKFSCLNFVICHLILRWHDKRRARLQCKHCSDTCHHSE